MRWQLRLAKIFAAAFLGATLGNRPASAAPAAPPVLAKQPVIGLTDAVGPKGEIKRVRTLSIDKPGVYENYLVDAEWGDVDAVRIKADNVTLRNCEIRHARRDGVEVYGADVLIENCRIHHLLAGTFKDQKDAHGITGRPTRLTIRNCQIGYVSGDCLQFDPGRGVWTDVVVEHCDLFTGPLPAAAAGFAKGEQPGENGLDTKQTAANPRSKITMRRCIVHGFAKGGQIGNLAALNIKNHVDAVIEECRFYDNEICLRLRGAGKGSEYGGAHVTARGCWFYDSDMAIRLEDRIERATIERPAFGEGIGQKVRQVGGESPGFKLTDEQKAPPLRR